MQSGFIIETLCEGTLSQESYIRPNRLITADEAIVIRSVGQLSTALTQRVIQKLIEILNR